MDAAVGAIRSALRVGEWVVYDDLLRIEAPDRHALLEPRPMQLLLYLADRPDQVVAPDQLLTEIWGGTFYGDAPLQRAIAMLRRALGDSASVPRYIQTVRKRGYRFIAPVSRAAVHAGVSTPRWTGRPPFRGLRPYTRYDAAVFFGRTQAVEMAARAVVSQATGPSHLVLILGPSGVGKTSLVQAGLLPLLQRSGGIDGIQAGAMAQLDLADISDEGLLSGLSVALRGLQTHGGALWAGLAADQLADEHAPARLNQMLCAGPFNSTQRLVLVVDHAEQLGSEADRNAVAAFERVLGAFAKAAQALVVMIARSDRYPELLLALPSLVQWKLPQGHVDIGPPSHAELAEILRGPATTAGLSYERDAGRGVGLDVQLLEDCAGHAHPLPLLQFVLARLYELRTPSGMLTWTAYNELGRIGGAIALRADAALEDLDAAVRESGLDALLSGMVRAGSDHLTYGARPVSWLALRSDAVREVAHRLVDARLVAADLARGEPQLRLAHEALLATWPAASTWVERNQKRLQVLGRLRSSCSHWLAQGHPDDLLLPEGVLLSEAEGLRRAWSDQLDADEHRFIAASGARQSTQQRVRASLWGTLAVAVLGGVAALVFARSSERYASEQRDAATQLAGVLVDKLPDRLRPLGRLDLLDDVSSAVLASTAEAECSEGRESALVRTKALRTQGEVLRERGQADAAMVVLHQAAICVESARGATLEPTVLLESATISFWLGTLALEAKSFAKARVYYDEYAATARQLVHLQPDKPKWMLEESYAQSNLGTVAMAQGDLDDAIERFQASVNLKRQVLEKSQSDAAILADLADSYSWLALALDRKGLRDQALAQVTQQVDLTDQLVRSDPVSTQWLFRRGLAYGVAGDLAIALSPTQALHYDALAIRDLGAAAQVDPGNALWAFSHFHAYVQRAGHELQGGKLEEAWRDVRAAERLVPSSGPVQSIARTQSVLDTVRANLLIAEGRLDEAARYAENATKVLVAQRTDAPTDVDVFGAWLRAQATLGQLRAALGDVSTARRIWGEALTTSIPLGASLSDRRIADAQIVIKDSLSRQSATGEHLTAANKGEGYD